ncbi:hypothetical protein Droror1_Dr00015127 [Drosera rotundifolia]
MQSEPRCEGTIHDGEEQFVQEQSTMVRNREASWDLVPLNLISAPLRSSLQARVTTMGQRQGPAIVSRRARNRQSSDWTTSSSQIIDGTNLQAPKLLSSRS